VLKTFDPRSLPRIEGALVAVRRNVAAVCRIDLFFVDPHRWIRLIFRDSTAVNALLSPSEKAVLLTFQEYLIAPGKMFCFSGPNLEKHKAALQQLTKKDLLIKERFNGAYSLTRAGFKAMKACDK
jgi:hypothetical protein